MRTSRKRKRIALGGAVGIAAVAAVATAIAASTDVGPNSGTEPYVVPVAKGVKITSLLTVSDDEAASNDYEMAGIPDGLGALKEGKRDFRLFMNHEIPANMGVVRRHGEKGAFVADLTIDRKSFEVEAGEDLVDPGVRFWNYPEAKYQTAPSPAGDNPRVPEDPVDPAKDDFVAQLAAFGRWCSSSVTEPGQLYNEKTGRGYKGQIYLGNEEIGNEGRSFGVTTSGQAQQLPRLGLFSWENTLAGLNKGDTTYTMGQEDAAGGQLWVYMGQKQSKGSAFDKAGLTNGLDFVVDLDNEAVATDAGFRSSYGKNNPARFDLGPEEEVSWDQKGDAQNAEAAAEGLTLNRIEDGAFDPRHPEDFYFVTTEGSPGTVPGTNPPVSRDGGGVWRLSYDDVERPWKGGTLTLLLDGTEAPFLNKPDNVGMDRKGHLMIQEDPGNNAQLARIVAYDVDTGERGVVAEFDEFQFGPGAPGFITQDEESSGIIDASKVIGKGWFLFDAQVHKTNPDPAAVEYGQLLAMKVGKWGKVFGG
ncbi:MAG TPA: alkaline phosphatase PhoX [Solirubrobacterales bacterium]|nr:alkaline phosphatase PhoX [Solirubrobacterales bacterium]